MRIVLLSILILILICSLNLGYIKGIYIEYQDSHRTDNIVVKEIDDNEYVNILDLERILKAKFSWSSENQTLILHIMDKDIIFLYDFHWIKAEKNFYNLHKKIVIKDGYFYIPFVFVTHILPQIFPKYIRVTKNKIKIDIPELFDSSVKKIVIDPGHGGKDPGAIGRYWNTHEKDIVLKIAKKLKRILTERLDIEVVLTREKDEFISLLQRTEIANKEDADLFISIHCNASKDIKANGTSVFFLSSARTDEERAVAALENAAIRYEGGEDVKKQYTELDFILSDLAQNEFLIESSELATMIEANIITSVFTRDRGVRQADFYVLRGVFMPAVLVETAFISNKKEEKKLRSDKFQQAIAEAIYNGIKRFKHKYDRIR